VFLHSKKHDFGHVVLALKKVLDNQQKRIVIGLLLALLTTLSAMGLLALSGWLITATAITGLAITAGSVVLLDIYRPGGGIPLFCFEPNSRALF